MLFQTEASTGRPPPPPLVERKTFRFKMKPAPGSQPLFGHLRCWTRKKDGRNFVGDLRPRTSKTMGSFGAGHRLEEARVSSSRSRFAPDAPLAPKRNKRRLESGDLAHGWRRWRGNTFTFKLEARFAKTKTTCRSPFLRVLLSSMKLHPGQWPMRGVLDRSAGAAVLGAGHEVPPALPLSAAGWVCRIGKH